MVFEYFIYENKNKNSKTLVFFSVHELYYNEDK
jgi:hypothetical protein